MLYIGRFSREDLINGRDKKEIKRIQDITGLKYVSAKEVKKGKEIIGLDVYLREEY